MKLNKLFALILSTSGIISLITSCGGNNPSTSISYEESNSLRMYYPENEPYLYGNYYFDEASLSGDLSFSFPLVTDKIIDNIKSFVFMDKENKQAIKYKDSKLDSNFFTDKTSGMRVQIFNFEIDPNSLKEDRHITSVKISAATPFSSNFIEIELPLNINFIKSETETFTDSVRFSSIDYTMNDQNTRKYETEFKQTFNNSITLKSLSFEGFSIEKFSYRNSIEASKTYINNVDTVQIVSSKSHYVNFEAAKSSKSASINGNIPYMHCEKIDGTSLIIPMNTYGEFDTYFTPLLNTSFSKTSIIPSLDLSDKNIKLFGVL